MKKNFLIFIAFITSFSVIGIIVTQYIWAQRAIKLRTEQFDEKIEDNLSNVVIQIADFQRDRAYYGIVTDTMGLNKIISQDELTRQMYSMIDSLLDAEFTCFEHDTYYFGIIDSTSGKILFSNTTESNYDDLLNSDHRISIRKISLNKNLTLAVFFPNQKYIVERRMYFWVQFLSGLFLLIVIGCFLFIIFTVFRQKRISEMKTDFVNNMTHEFKTPISTISVASEMLMRQKIYESPEKIQKYANIIFDENLILRNQVEQVLQISILDKNELKIDLAEIDVHPVIMNSVDIFNMIVKEKHGEITADLAAPVSVILADELHFINVVTNMLDNAIKYTDTAPLIRISTYNRNNGIVIRVEDDGIGIEGSNHKYIYRKFFRVHTGDVHNVKGFGLGLFYVKSVMNAHKGTIELVKSELHQGSIFELYFPFNLNKI